MHIVQDSDFDFGISYIQNNSDDDMSKMTANSLQVAKVSIQSDVVYKIYYY